MDAQPKIGGFGCFKGVLQIPFFLLMQFHKAIFYFNPKMGHAYKIRKLKRRATLISGGRRPPHFSKYRNHMYAFLIGDPNIILFVFSC